MMLSDKDLRKAIECKEIVVSPFNDYQIGPSSIDLCLGSVILRYTSSVIRLERENPNVKSVVIESSNGFSLKPKQFVLGSTQEIITISPNYQGWIETRGSIARAGISVHNCDGHIDPGFSGNITLEITNHNSIPIILYPGIRICQMFVFKLISECEYPYSGKYHRQDGPTAYRI